MAPLIHSRRQFLTLLGQASALGAAAPLGLNLLAARSAAALDDPSDYKALVCIFLYGGNDAYNTFVPYDRASHARYSSARSSIAVPRQGLASQVLNPSNPADHGRQIATNPVASDLTDLFNTGKLAVVANVGTLRRPITLDDYRNGRGVPPKLMSHNDQFSIWQTMDIEGAQSGWGGRMADLVVAANGESPMLTSISVGTSAVFAGGTSVDELAFGNQGPATLDSVQGNGSFHLDIASRLASISDQGPHAAELRRRYNNAVEGGQQATEVLQGINRLVPRPTGDEVPPIYDQLDTVARTIVGHQRRNIRRQVFFVSMGGYDTHTASNEVHPGLLTNLAGAMRSFTTAMEQAGLSDQVTAFTASDFGRALTTNGQGTDHGWGGHHVVVGGSVKPQTIAGELPTVRLGGPDDIGQGRLLPAVSVEQYGATLARWFGVPERELPIVFPGIGAFPTSDLGFMAPITPPPGSTTTTA
ncbi:MAG: DUF1501 domain-containing protein, partial [Acidimicrobiales bacterium]